MSKKDDLEKDKGGRPTKYQGEVTDELARKFALLGGTDVKIAELLGVCEKTLNVWKSKYPSFLVALQSGKQQADAEVAEALFYRARGYTTKETKIATHEGQITDILEVDKHYPPDTAAAMAWLKNRTGGKYKQTGTWADKQEVEHTGDIGVTFNMDFSSDNKESED